MRQKSIEAIESFKATEFGSDGPWRQLGNAFYYLKQYEEARLAFNGPLNSSPMTLFYMWYRVRCCEQQGVTREAIRFCDRALKSIRATLVYPARFYPLQRGRAIRSDRYFSDLAPQPDYADAYGEQGFLSTFLEDYQGDRRFQ